MPYRIGTGFDIHRLVADRPLILGGVTVPCDKGLLGHSDGDALVHAVCDALLGARNKGDIGALYPDTAAHTLNMDSLVMLREIVADLDDYEIVNIDTNVICEKPKLSPYRTAMVESLAQACGIASDRVSVKFRTHEGLGPLGAGEAISCQASVLLMRRREN